MEVKRIPDILPYIREKYGRADVLNAKVNGEWKSWAIQQFCELSDALSYGLMHHGIMPGDAIAIISANRPEWNVSDFGIAALGAVSVPVYPTMGNNETAFILKDAGVKIALVADEALYNKIQAIRHELPELKAVYTFDKVNGAKHFDELLQDGRSNPQPDQLKAYTANIRPDDLLTLIYTSGTTGVPKGVMLTHNNLISNVHGSRVACPVTYEHKVLSFLPLSHIFERMLVYLYLYVGAGIYYAENMDTIGDNLKEVKPFAFSTVPRLLEKVYDKIVAKGSELTGIKKKLFFWALDLGHRYELSGANGVWFEMQLKLANKLIFSKWREALGGNVGVIVSGAAALQPRLARVFTAAQIPVLEGYGLTETSPVISVNRLVKGQRAFGSVGLMLDEVEVKIAEDGEILCKGPNVMKGYYKRPDLTAEVMKDGWFYTGDIGKLEKGLLWITDRKKEIFKTSGGKYIAPQVLENKFKESIFIEQIMVVGEGQKHASALIVPSYDALKKWCDEQGLVLSRGQMTDNPKVRSLFESEVERYNAGFGQWETVKKFKLLEHEWTIDGGELTPSLKLKRRVIQEKFSSEIEAFYKEA